MSARVLRGAALMLAVLTLAPAAQASRPATDQERASIAALSGINGACLDIAVSTIDPTIAAYGFTGAAGCPNKGNMVALKANPSGFQVIAFLTGGENCPLNGIPTPVGLELKLCTEPPPPVYVPEAKKLREQPAKLTLSSRRGALSSLEWASWGGANAKASGRYKAAGAKKAVGATVTLSGRTTCSGGKQIYTTLKLKLPRGAKNPFAKATRIATCASAGA